ncbi:MAG TPA: hypothetical protein DCP92_17360 [Nitrospiraceae bacterium]|jgi:hypothetical protein|nr:hypothetical protein [Nitrospiraceae bacterium]
MGCIAFRKIQIDTGSLSAIVNVNKKATDKTKPSARKVSLILSVISSSLGRMSAKLKVFE